MERMRAFFAYPIHYFMLETETWLFKGQFQGPTSVSIVIMID